MERKTPAALDGRGTEKLGGFRSLPTLQAYQVQFLTLAHAVRPEWAAMVAALAFGGNAA